MGDFGQQKKTRKKQYSIRLVPSVEKAAREIVARGDAYNLTEAVNQMGVAAINARLPIVTGAR